MALAVVGFLTAGPEGVPGSHGSGSSSVVGNGSTTSLEVDVALQGELRPGRSAPLVVEFVNPSVQNVLVEDLLISIDDIDAPSSTDGLPCSAADFVVTQAPVSVLVPAGGRRSLPDSDRTDGPRVEMIDSDQDQSGCKDATLVITARATGEQRS